MKKHNKTLIVLILIIIFIIVFIIMKEKKTEREKTPIDNSNIEVNKKSAEESKSETKTNKNKKFNEAKTIKGFKISDISFTEKDGEAVLNATVTNVSGRNIKDYTYFKITLLDENDKEIATIPGIINPVEKNATTKLKATIIGKTEEYINAYDFKIEIDKK
ncbi:MAG: hypothetical protein ILA02_07075 [Clostridia bacterium]|nr:hypothetical protein [Clostridia bacterium]